MDRISRAFYEMKFELEFRRKNMDEFQDFFAKVMALRYPNDFVKVRPWGKVGDRKNDGYRRSTRQLFQVYAPNEMTAAKAVAKIDEDFRGAVPFWKDHFSEWIFVHNSAAGLGPDVTQKLLTLSKEFPEITLGHWGYQELYNEVVQLDAHNMAQLLGPALSQRALLEVNVQELRTVLQMVAQAPAPTLVDLRPVPLGKAEYNRLSEPIQTLLNAGRSRAHLVERALQTWFDPAVGDRIASGLRRRYEELRDAGYGPSEIFSDLQTYCGGLVVGSPEHQAAVLSVLAYYFDECDIFERPLNAQV